MTDAIRGIGETGAAAGINPSAGAKTGQTSGGTQTGSTVPVDSADISQTQSLFETINASVAAAPAVDQEKVAAIRQALANGTYTIDPRQIATQMLGAEQALPGASSPSE